LRADGIEEQTGYERNLFRHFLNTRCPNEKGEERTRESPRPSEAVVKQMTVV
jgi:hypothetical protein